MALIGLSLCEGRPLYEVLELLTKYRLAAEQTGQSALLDQEGLADEEAMGLLRTLRGSVALVGLTHIGGLCHDLESSMQDEGRGLLEAERGRLVTSWRELRKQIAFAVPERHTTSIPA